MYVKELTARLASSSTRWYTPTSACCASTIRLSCAMTMRPFASTWSRLIEDADVVWLRVRFHYCMIVATVRLSCTMTMRPSASTWSRSIEDADVVWLRVRFYYWREEVMCVRLFIIVFASTWSGSIEDADWECVVWLRVCFMWRCGHA